MPYIKTYPLPNSAILRINSERENINVQPWYQRRGEVWTLEKRQLLIDSILNDYDIPKLYFHVLSVSQKTKDNHFDYAIIDGRQRLEAIWDFTDDKFPLIEDFVYLLDSEVNAGGLKYSELSFKYPKLKIRFDSFTLPIVCVDTDDIDLIEDMFSRLNEAVPLNAAEKRNAIGGPMAECIREVAKHHFFTNRVKFEDKRYQHREVSARILFIEYSLLFQKKIIDTKKPYLDDMVKKYKSRQVNRLDEIKRITVHVLNYLDATFDDKDPLLRAQAVIPIYYLVMKQAIENQNQSKFNRNSIESFLRVVSENRETASRDIANSNFELLEYDRMTQQGTNDSTSIRERVRILTQYLDI